MQSNSNAMRSDEPIARQARSSEFKEHPKHCFFPSLAEQIAAHKHAYTHLQIEPVLEFVAEGDWSSAALPPGADGWYARVADTSGHYSIDSSTAKRKLAIRRAFSDRTNVLPMDLRRTDYARDAFAKLRGLQPFDIQIVAVQLGRTSLGGISVEQRRSAHEPGEYPLGVREIADMLRIMSRLESPQDLGIDCGADRYGADMVPCFSFENRTIVLASRPKARPDYSFAEASWFMPKL